MPIKQTLNQDNGEWDRTRANRRGEPAWDFLGELWVSFGNPPSGASEQSPTGVDTKHKLERKGDAGTFGKLWETLGNFGKPWFSLEKPPKPRFSKKSQPTRTKNKHISTIGQNTSDTPFCNCFFLCLRLCVGTYAFV